MRKFLPFVLCGVAALSYSQLGVTAEADPGEQPKSEHRGNQGPAASDKSAVERDRAGVYRNKDDKRAARNKRDADSSAGSSSTGSSSNKGNDSKAMDKDDSTNPSPKGPGN